MGEALITDGSSGVEAALAQLAAGGAAAAEAIAGIDEAAARGDPAALERSALFAAVGCDRPQSWQRAFDLLAQAADGGSECAKGQLQALAGTAATGDWPLLREKIDTARLLSVPDKQVLSDSPRLRVMKGFATAAECDWLIHRARGRLQPATVVDRRGSLSIESARSNRAVEFQFADMDVVVELLRARTAAATRLPLPLFEPSQVLNYAPGEEFRPHYDYFDPANAGHAEQLRFGQRIATFLVYLNDDYAGGETAFPRASIDYRGETGDALFIANVDRSGRPDPMTLHAGLPPTAGQKWLFSQWIRDRAPVAPRSGA